jgi:hypothetical protein
MTGASTQPVPLEPYLTGTDGPWLLPVCAFYVAGQGTPSVPEPSTKEGTTMKNIVKSGTFRTLMLLSALASSGLVLEAARRW